MSASRPINEGEVCNARIVELELDPVRGTFDAAHLREIHRRISRISLITILVSIVPMHAATSKNVGSKPIGLSAIRSTTLCDRR